MFVIWGLIIIIKNKKSKNHIWININSLPIKANNWAIRRINLFNEHVKQRKVPTRLDHFLNYYLEQDGELKEMFKIKILFGLKHWILEKGIFMIRMIANNTSDYVATDLIHQLWCQHDEKYGEQFFNEPHQSTVKCTFEHTKKDEATTMDRQNSQLSQRHNLNAHFFKRQESLFNTIIWNAQLSYFIWFKFCFLFININFFKEWITE